MTELYLYQTIHLSQGRPRQLDEHVAVLDNASRALFGRSYAPDLRKLTARITALAEAERYPIGVAGFVRLELLPDGRERLLPDGVSLYEGYALRSVTPDARCVAYDNPLSDAPTSAREAAAQLARCQAHRQGAQVAVRCDAAGALHTIDDAPLFALRDRCVVTPPAMRTVERDLGMRAVRAAGFELLEVPVLRDELPLLEELFFVDHRGVTALGHCDEYPMMSLVAGHVAEALETLF